MSEWISVKDRLPADQEEVICWDSLYKIADYDEETRQFMYGRDFGGWYFGTLPNVTHWMPLPAPPSINT